MSTDDTHLAALEKNATVTTQDIICKIDEVNSALTILKEVLEDRGRDIKDIKVCLDGINQHPTSMEEKADKRFEQFDQRFK